MKRRDTRDIDILGSCAVPMGREVIPKYIIIFRERYSYYDKVFAVKGVVDDSSKLTFFFEYEVEKAYYFNDLELYSLVKSVNME